MQLLKNEKLLGVVIGGAIIGLILLNGVFFTVKPGEVAIKVRLGRLVNSYDEGFYFKLPLLDSTEKFSIRISRTDIKTDSFSMDLQPVIIDVVVNHRIEKDTVQSIYRNLGTNYERTIIDPIVQEEVKSVISKFSAESLVSNRSNVTNQISEIIKKRLLEKLIIITDISITNFDFTPAFLKSVEDKQIAEQRAKKAGKDVERVKMEATQAIERARAEAKALQLQKQAVSPDLIELRKVEAQLKAIEKWDGKLPYYNGGAIPFIQLDMKK